MTVPDPYRFLPFINMIRMAFDGQNYLDMKDQIAYFFTRTKA